MQERRADIGSLPESESLYRIFAIVPISHVNLNDTKSRGVEKSSTENSQKIHRSRMATSDFHSWLDISIIKFEPFSRKGFFNIHAVIFSRRSF